MVSRYDRTFIGIDYGKKRIGLSKSDPSGSIASPLTTLEVSSDKEALSAVLGFINRYSPDGLVVGYPLHESGDNTDKCKEVDAFIEELARLYAGPIHRIDERYKVTAGTKRILQVTISE